MAKKSSKWIKGAIEHPGAFSAKAKAAGKSTAEFAREKENAPGKLGKQARLAETLMGMNKGGKKKDEKKSDEKPKSRAQRWYGAKEEA